MSVLRLPELAQEVREQLGGACPRLQPLAGRGLLLRPPEIPKPACAEIPRGCSRGAQCPRAEVPGKQRNLVSLWQMVKCQESEVFVCAPTQAPLVALDIPAQVGLGSGSAPQPLLAGAASPCSWRVTCPCSLLLPAAWLSLARGSLRTRAGLWASLPDCCWLGWTAPEPGGGDPCLSASRASQARALQC